jgi:hypothetical protein
MSKVCGCKTKEGGRCIRPTGGLKCYQHRGTSASPKRKKTPTTRRSAPSPRRKRSSHITRPSLQMLPNEIQEHIYSFADRPTFGSLQRASRKSRALSSRFTSRHYKEYREKKCLERPTLRMIYKVPHLTQDVMFVDNHGTLYSFFIPDTTNSITNGLVTHSQEVWETLYLHDQLNLNARTEPRVMYWGNRDCYPVYITKKFIEPTLEILKRKPLTQKDKLQIARIWNADDYRLDDLGTALLPRLIKLALNHPNYISSISAVIEGFTVMPYQRLPE